MERLHERGRELILKDFKKSLVGWFQRFGGIPGGKAVDQSFEEFGAGQHAGFLGQLGAQIGSDKEAPTKNRAGGANRVSLSGWNPATAVWRKRPGT